MKYKILNTLVMALFVAFFLWGCLSGSGGNSTGTLSVGLTDASTDQYQAVYVTVSEIQVHQSADGEETEEGWISVGTPNATYNLLDLVNGVRESVGLSDLDTGHYTQMRLIVGENPDSTINLLSQPHPFANYVIDLEGDLHELKVPSGMQSGIKIVQGFEINVNETTELVLDFNASASVVVAGNSGQYLLKPTIQMLDTHEAAIISGDVTQSSEVLTGATVSAQIFDDMAVDAEDRVTVQAATLSDDAGHYSLFLSPGTYNLVFYKEGFQAFVAKITVVAGDSVTQDATLDAATTGTLLLTSNISDTDSEAHATTSFRRNTTVDDVNVEIELFALNIADGGDGLITLPTGDVVVVTSSFEETTQSITVVIDADTQTVLNVSL